MKTFILASLAISLTHVRSLNTIFKGGVRRFSPSLVASSGNIFTSAFPKYLGPTKTKRIQRLYMSSSSGIENPMNPNLYTEKAWEAIAKSPQFCDKYSTQYVETPILMKVDYSNMRIT